MTRLELLSLVDEKINEAFLAYQQSEGIMVGDISPDDSFAIDELSEKLTALIISSMEKNR